MDESDVDERLRQITGRFFAPKPSILLGGTAPPFDTSKPNLHDSKAAFIEEKRAVEKTLELAGKLFEFMAARYDPEGGRQEVSERVLQYVDVSTRKGALRERPDTIWDMIRKNAADAGLTFCLTLLLADLIKELNQRKQELETQEATFWNLSGRPPNYYARTIALRFARLIARETGKMPTFGTARDGGHPSTEFGRALEEVFKTLGIKSDVRNAAKWAIRQLSEDDLKPEPKNYGNLNALLSLGTPPHQNALAAYGSMLMEDRKR